MAIAMGVVTGDKSYMLGTEKIGYRKNWENDTEFWEKKALPLLEQTLKEKVCYGTSAVDKIKESDDFADTEDTANT